MLKIFTPFKIKNQTIRNRIVMPPLEYLIPSACGGFVDDRHLEHYGRRARGGVGLIIVEATSIDPQSRTAVSQLGAWSDEFIAGLARLADQCHQEGAKVLLQLQHLGIRMKKDPMGPSAYTSESIAARAMTLPEIKRLQNAYVAAVSRAAKAGFDGVEFHGVHGFLLNQFSAPQVNVRRDAYGGSLQHRLNFFGELFARARQQVGDDFIFGYRMPYNQPQLSGGIQMAGALVAMGVDLLHVSHCGYSNYVSPLPADFPFDPSVFGAGQIRKAVPVPVIAANGIRTPQRAEAILQSELADFTAIGKDLVTDADWVKKAKQGDPIRHCIQCDPCRLFSRKPCILMAE